MKYTEEQHRLFAERVRADSFCILPAHFDSQMITQWAHAFEPLLQRHIDREGKRQNRGPARYYVTLPFQGVFANPAIFEDPDVIAIVQELVGQDFVFCQLASDTPLLGSDYQDLHRDAPPLFPEWQRETPPFQLAVNFPLVDVTMENGPMEVARGTHVMAKDDALAAIERKEVVLEPLLMQAGDVMIRDVRSIHRGTPNRGGTARPMIVLGYSRRWLFRPEVSISIPKVTYDALSPAARHMLRYNPVVEELSKDAGEVYQSFAY